METRQLKLITVQKYDTHDNRDEYSIEAVVAERNGSNYITFKQFMPDQNVVVNNIVKIKKGVVYVKRSGGLSSDLFFDVDKECTSSYETPYGLLDIRIKTESVESTILQDDVKVKICYEIMMQGKKISDNIYIITSEVE